MPTVTRFEDLEAWKMARDMTREIYRVTKKEPFCRDFGLKDQICRASVSVMSNIAEGFERDGTKEFINLLSIAKGSCGEVRSQLFVAVDQSYLSSEEFSRLYDLAARNSRIINGLMRYLIQSDLRGHKFGKK